jgi:hypothetical protein
MAMAPSITASATSAVRIGAGRQLVRGKNNISQHTIYIYLSDGARFHLQLVCKAGLLIEVWREE